MPPLPELFGSSWTRSSAKRASSAAVVDRRDESESKAAAMSPTIVSAV
jgi:hypothetical protein